MLPNRLLSRWIECKSIAVFSLLVLCWASIAPAQSLVNGSFETGDFTGWTQNGFLNLLGPGAGFPAYSSFLGAESSGLSRPAPDTNAVISSQTIAFDGFGVPGPAVLPLDGNYMAFVSDETSAGDRTLSGSSISQTFTVPAGAHTLSMDLRLLNDDNIPFLSPDYNDVGGVALTQGTEILDEYDMDVLPFEGLICVTPLANVGGFQNSSPWEMVDFNVAGLVGQDVTLTAYAANVGDDHVETRLLIDDVTLSEPSSAIPEPVSSALMGIGGLIALARRRR
jgi:hypothetical protein